MQVLRALRKLIIIFGFGVEPQRTGVNCIANKSRKERKRKNKENNRVFKAFKCFLITFVITMITVYFVTSKNVTSMLVYSGKSSVDKFKECFKLTFKYVPM